MTLVVRGARLTTPGGLTEPVDLLIAGATIDDVVPAGSVPVPDAAHVIDAAGRIAFPGFIDSHVHGEAAVLDPDVQLAMLRQGVTSVVVGQDGVSYALRAAARRGRHPDAHAWATSYFSAINGEHPTFRGGSVTDLLATYEGTTPLNVAYLVPHGTLRYGVMGGAARPATPDETGRMTALLREALDDGRAACPRASSTPRPRTRPTTSSWPWPASSPSATCPT
ncbi:amidohydrolase family protein [Oerskovia sp. M15]